MVGRISANGIKKFCLIVESFSRRNSGNSRGFLHFASLRYASVEMTKKISAVSAISACGFNGKHPKAFLLASEPLLSSEFLKWDVQM